MLLNLWFEVRPMKEYQLPFILLTRKLDNPILPNGPANDSILCYVMAVSLRECKILFVVIKDSSCA